MTETIVVQLIVGLLAFIVRLIQERDNTNENIQSFRRSVAKGDTPAVCGALREQHDRLQQALRHRQRSGDDPDPKE